MLDNTVRTFGNIRLLTETVEDNHPDLWWLGEWTFYKFPAKPDQKLVDRYTGSVLSHDGIWRDERGRIVATPEHRRGGREYQYTFHDNGHESVKHAYQDHQRLVRYGDWWSMVGVRVAVILNGVTIASAGEYGIESDSADSHFRRVARELTFEAIHDARAWLAKIPSQT